MQFGQFFPRFHFRILLAWQGFCPHRLHHQLLVVCCTLLLDLPHGFPFNNQGFVIEAVHFLLLTGCFLFPIFVFTLLSLSFKLPEYLSHGPQFGTLNETEGFGLLRLAALSPLFKRLKSGSMCFSNPLQPFVLLLQL